MTSYLRLSNKTQQEKRVSQITRPVVKGYPTLTKEDLKLSENALSPDQQDCAWKKVHDYLFTYKSTMIGFQINQDLHHSDRLKDYLDVHINNVGDPFLEGSFSVNTKGMECAVLDYFAKLWNIDQPDSLHGEDHNATYWGYVASMGCTEANLYALYNARDYLSGKPRLHCGNKESCLQNNKHCYTKSENSNTNAFMPIAFYSEDSHYSISKATHLLKINTFHEIGSGNFQCPLIYPDDYPSMFSEDLLDQNGWPHLVPIGEDSSMYLPSLVKLVEAFSRRGHPPIVVFTSGATFRGNYENPQAAINTLVPILKENNLYERKVYYSSKDPSKFDVCHGFWFHVDAAMGGTHLPFLEKAINQGQIENKFPNGFPVFDFRIPEVMSISTSFHKWLGCPFPAAIYMTRRTNQLQPPTNPTYIGSPDTTFAGSRNGHGVMMVWDLLSRKSYHDFTEQAVKGENMASFAFQKLQELEMKVKEDLWLSRSPGSLYITFKQVRADFGLKYSLSSTGLLVKSKQGRSERRHYSHICVMPHVNEALIQSLINDLKVPGAIPVQY